MVATCAPVATCPDFDIQTLLDAVTCQDTDTDVAMGENLVERLATIAPEPLIAKNSQHEKNPL
jgi:hypothetical protein